MEDLTATAQLIWWMLLTAAYVRDTPDTCLFCFHQAARHKMQPKLAQQENTPWSLKSGRDFEGRKLL